MWLLIILVFAIWVPDTFLTQTTFDQILNNNAVTGLMALCVIIPLAARVFDLSIAFTMTLSGVIVAHFVAHTGVGVVPAVALALGAALAIGLINGFVVVGLGVDSFIGTLATGSLIKAFITMVTNDQSITGVKLLQTPFSSIAQTDIAGLTLPVLYLLADRRGDLVRARAHGHGAAALRDRLQPRRRAPGRTSRPSGCASSRSSRRRCWPASPGSSSPRRSAPARRPRATRICLRRTRPPSWARRSCAAAGSTPGAP